MKRVRISDIELSVHDEGSGPVLLLVHGFPLDHSMWQHQIPFFAKTHRVIVPDLRGFGKSDPAHGTVTMERYSDDLSEMLDALQITEPVNFCGLSMGGYVAWQFHRRHGKRIAKLVLCDTRSIADSGEAAEHRLQLATQVESHGTAIVAEGMLPKLFGSEADPQTVENLKQVILHNQPSGVAAALRGMSVRPDVTTTLGSIGEPTLLVCGEQDVISPPAEMREIAQAIAHATFVEIAGCGHMSPLEAPEPFNAALSEFLHA